jgi:hypothetical protein
MTYMNHFEKDLRRHHDVFSHSEYRCHKLLGVYTVLLITIVQFFSHFCLDDEPRDISTFLHR